MRDPIQLSGAFESLEAMMRAHADSAVRIAAAEHGMSLDYSPESVARLDTILAARIPVPEPDLENATLLWGAYFGEVFRRRYSAAWIMAVYPRRPGAEPRREPRGPDADVAMPALDIAGSHIYPLLKISRRLTLGPAEDLASFYAKVRAALDARKSRETDK